MSELRHKIAGLWKRLGRTDITPTQPPAGTYGQGVYGAGTYGV